MRFETRDKGTLRYKLNANLALEVLLFEELVPEKKIVGVRYTTFAGERKHSPAEVGDHQLVKLPGLYQSH